MKTPLDQSSRVLKGLDEESAEYANLNTAITKVQNAEVLLEGFSKFSIVERTWRNGQPWSIHLQHQVPTRNEESQLQD
eukprot:678950-Amphidinium_carterae.1